MNVRAVLLGLKDTRFGNPHGLPNKNTKSTAYDLCLLIIISLAIPLYSKIVSTKHFRATITTTDNTKRVV